MAHYFTNDIVKDAPEEITIHFRDFTYKLNSNAGVFSKDKLDEGTRILLEMRHQKGEKSLETAAARFRSACTAACVDHVFFQQHLILYPVVSKEIIRIIAKPALYFCRFPGEQAETIGSQAHHYGFQCIAVGEEGLFRISVHIHECLRPAFRECVDKQMIGKRHHPVVPPVCLRHDSHSLRLVSLALSHPVLQRMLRVVKKIVKIAALGTWQLSRRP